MTHKLTKLLEGVYLLVFDNGYDLAMHFCRYQEFYESQNPDFNGKNFSMFDFMRWYSLENKTRSNKDFMCFTYPEDWAGFNIPSWVFTKLLVMGIPDVNKYDQFMIALHHALTNKSKGNYYLI